MSCLAWNCRGIRNAATVRDLCSLVKESGSQIVFLSETRKKSERVSHLRSRLGLRGFVGMDSDGMSGGLALFWHESIHMEIKSINERYIDVYVCLSRGEPSWHATFVYGEPRVENRNRMWSLLSSLKTSSSLPWIVLGDFNEALWQFEHFSIKKRNEPQMQSFRDVLQLCSLHDLGFSGVPYTFDNRREGQANLKVRLDRAVADDNWRELFNSSKVVHLTTTRSDHCPILVTLSTELQRQSRTKCRQYEIFWEREPALPEVIKDTWSDFGEKIDLGDINNALNRVMSAVCAWSRTKFKNVNKEIERVRKKLANLLESNGDRRAIRQVTDDLNELLYREEMLWLQWSRISWLKEGDRNTRFFHSKAIWRAKKNKITKLRDSGGTVHNTTKVMEKMATQYFREMYTADPNLDHSKTTQLIKEKVSISMNENLCKDFTEEEISLAMFQIGPLKAPGPDGFPARFYQRNWGTLKGDIVGAVKKFFVYGIMPQGVNETAIVLIPKVSQPLELGDFRPISLCNVIYKVVSKCLVNRLRPILDELVSPNQSAFVPGRLITDNALIAFECFHSIQKNKNSSNAACAYKLDLSKAYGRVDWKYLEQAMYKLGFAHQWVRWIMSCVTSVRFAVKFNGTLLSSFAPSRGLRQGDPLSPFLFLLVADGLSLLLEEKVEQGDLTPLQICCRAPGVSHLLFADDTLLFLKSNNAEAAVIKEVLENYAVSTGQRINPSKCSIMFGPGSPAAV